MKRCNYRSLRVYPSGTRGHVETRFTTDYTGIYVDKYGSSEKRVVLIHQDTCKRLLTFCQNDISTPHGRLFFGPS